MSLLNFYRQREIQVSNDLPKLTISLLKPGRKLRTADVKCLPEFVLRSHARIKKLRKAGTRRRKSGHVLVRQTHFFYDICFY